MSSRAANVLSTLVGALLVACAGTPSAEAPEPGLGEPAAVAKRIRHRVVVDGHPITVWAKEPSAPRGKIVLVHGRTWSAAPDFDLRVEGEELSLMDGLVAAGWASYAVDLRGYGGTPRDATGWLTPRRAAADLAVVLEWVAAQPPTGQEPALLGWSYGSMVSQLTVQGRPELVTDLVLYGYPRDPDLLREDPAAAAAPVESESESESETEATVEVPVPAEPERRENTAEAAASDFITPGSISSAAVQAFVAQSLAADPVRVDWKDEHEWNALDPSKVTRPTLVLHGEHDPFAPVHQQARLFERLADPDRRWVILAGADHAAHLEHARDPFLAAVLGFLERPRRAR